MRKTTLVAICLMIITVLFGCSDKKEYTMVELEDKIYDVCQKFEEETSELTDDEIGEQRADIYERLAKKERLPVDKEITVRGKMYSRIEDFISIASFKYDLNDEEEEFNNKRKKILYCALKNGEKAIFIEDGQNLLIKGIFMKEKNGVGLYDCEIISPEIKVPDFENNVEDFFKEWTYSDDYYYKNDVLIFGTVSEITENSASDNQIEEKYGNDSMLCSAFEYSDRVVKIVDKNNPNYFLVWFTSSNGFDVGDDICIKNNLYESNDGNILFAHDITVNNEYYVYN